MARKRNLISAPCLTLIWETTPAGQPADWSLLALPNDTAEKNDWEIALSNALGYVLEFKKNLTEPIIGLRDFELKSCPHLVGLIDYAFHTMFAIGFFLAFLMLWSTLYWWLGKLSAEKNVLVSLSTFVAVYTLWFVTTLYFGSRTIHQGPNLDLPVPGLEPDRPVVDTTPGEFVPDERPVEAQQ